MYISVVLLCTAVACAWAWLWWSGRRVRSCFKHLPAFPPLPLLGNSDRFYRGAEDMYNLINDLGRKSDETDLPAVVWVGPYPILLCMNPDDIRLITYNLIEKPYFYDFGKIWFGNGILTAPGSTWKHTIKKVGGAFSNAVVNSYQEVFNMQAQKLVTRLRKKVGSPPFDVIDDLSFITLETICHTAMGVPEVSKEIVTPEYYQAYNEAMKLLMKRGLNPLMHFEAIFRLTPDYRKLLKCMNVIHGANNAVTRRKVDERINEKNKQEKADSSKKFNSLLEILLELKDSDPMFTPEQIQSEVNTVIFGGQETSATSMYFILLLIGSKPEIQDKLYAEMHEIFGDSNRPVDTEDLARMKYCEGVIMETLRLYPPFTAITRCADSDLQIKSCLIPKGTICGINILGAGRSRRGWGPDALEFRPERWLNPDLDSTSLYAFSYGRRACIGKKYAIALEKTLLATILREFRFTSEPENNLRLKAEPSMRAIAGNLIQVHLKKLPSET